MSDGWIDPEGNEYHLIATESGMVVVKLEALWIAVSLARLGGLQNQRKS